MDTLAGSKLGLGLVVLVVTVSASAARVWEDRAPTPGLRGFHAMAYDSVRGKTVLFGGAIGSGYAGDTWEWDGATWTQVAAGGPAARN